MYSTDLPQAGMQSSGLGDERLADAGLPDEQHRSTLIQPLPTVEFLDLRFADRAAGGEVDIFERGSQSALGGFDAIAGLALLAIVSLGLQQRIEELGVAGLITGCIRDRLIVGGEHAEQFHLGHEVSGHSGTHRYFSWLWGGTAASTSTERSALAA